MRVVLGPLAKSGLESHAGSDLLAAVNAALVYYVGRLDSGQRPPRFPDFPLTQGKEGGGATDERGPDPANGAQPEVDIDVDDRIEAALLAEARDQGVGLAELAGHAVLVYLAKVDLIGDPEGECQDEAGDVAVPAGDVDDSTPR